MRHTGRKIRLKRLVHFSRQPLRVWTHPPALKMCTRARTALTQPFTLLVTPNVGHWSQILIHKWPMCCHWTMNIIHTEPGFLGWQELVCCDETFLTIKKGNTKGRALGWRERLMTTGDQTWFDLKTDAHAVKKDHSHSHASVHEHKRCEETSDFWHKASNKSLLHFVTNAPPGRK